MRMQQKVILIYQQYKPLNILMEQILWSKGYYNVYIIRDLSQFKMLNQALEPEVILFELDSYADYEQLEDLLSEPQSCKLHTKLIGISGYGNENVERYAKDLGVKAFIKKPFNIHCFIEEVEEKLKSRLYEQSHI